MKTVLVADDHEDIRTVVALLLEAEKIKVIQAKNGEECIRKFKESKPDLVLLDLKMPGMTTNECLKTFTAEKNLPPFLLFSASRAKEIADDLIKTFKTIPIVDFIEKPFKNKDFVERIKKALNK